MTSGPSNARRVLHVEDPEDHVALTGWVGCPNCDGPVSVRALIEKHTSDILLTVLDALNDHGIDHSELTQRFERVAEDARILATATMRTHPFKAILPA